MNERRLEHEVLEEQREIRRLEREVEEIERLLKPKQLAFIKISIGGNDMLGPVTLTVGDKKTATVKGFDQNGAPFAIDFTANPVTWSIDNSTLDSSTPNADGSDSVVSLAAGTANLSATCAGFTDSEVITNVAVTPKLSSIKIDFA